MPEGARNQAIPKPERPPGGPAPRWRNARAWLERLWISIADRGRKFAPIPAITMGPFQRAKLLAGSLLSERGEASGAAVARELLAVIDDFSSEDRERFMMFLAEGFQPDEASLAEAARAYLAEPSPKAAGRLADAAEPPRQELLRRMNMAAGGTRALVALRKDTGRLLRAKPALAALDADLRHLFVSWFNRGFLDLRQIDWQTPAAILEKLIAYEAVHEIQGWDDLHRRLAADRRCFAFFHPGLPGEPLIFVEVALVKGLASSVRALLERDTDEAAQRRRAVEADTAIFYSISNCQDGLRGISFGNFLIKQVVEELHAELPALKHFSTLSPVPGFRAWLDQQLASGALPPLSLDERDRAALIAAASQSDGDQNLAAALQAILQTEGWLDCAAMSDAACPVLLRLCACYLMRSPIAEDRQIDPVARFHLGNGARLERINWMGNPEPRGLRESWGIMVNYLYDPTMIEANHEGFVREGAVAHSLAVDALLAGTAEGPQGQRRLRREVRRPRIGVSNESKTRGDRGR